jgi:transcriptional adapter 2-alpha
MGVELLTHKNDHSYRVIEHLTEPIFDRDWGADEERSLLEGILIYGFGNWQDIADHVNTKSKHKCQAHYTAVYLSGPTAPLPNVEVLLDSKVCIPFKTRFIMKHQY